MKMSAVKNTLIFLLSIFCLLPLVTMFLESFQGIHGTPTIEQYGRILFQSEEFFKGFWNSVIYTVVIIAINIPISLLAAYGFSQFNFHGRDILFWIYIVLMLMPFQATIVPQYLTLKALGVLDTPEAVILPNAFSTFGTFLIAQYMRGLDKEVFDAGRIDGLNELNLMLKIVLPICRPILLALTVLLFINYWSMVEQPLIFISDRQLLPLSVLLSSSDLFKKVSFASGIIFTILPLLLYLFCYEDLIQGIALSSTAKDRGKALWVSEKEEKSKFSRKLARKLILSFLIGMLGLTLVTQKLTYIMTAEVEVVIPRKGELVESPQKEDSKSLGYFQTIVPASCITLDGNESYIYIAAEEKSKRKKIQAVKVKVSLSSENGSEYAISGAIPYDAEIVRHTSKPLMDGDYIRVLYRSDEYD